MTLIPTIIFYLGFLCDLVRQVLLGKIHEDLGKICEGQGQGAQSPSWPGSLLPSALPSLQVYCVHLGS